MPQLSSSKNKIIRRPSTTTISMIYHRNYPWKNTSARKASRLLVSTSNTEKKVHNVEEDNNTGSNNILSSDNAIILPKTKPLAPHTFAGMVEQGMIQKFGNTQAISRIIESWRLLEQDYIHDYYIPTTTNNDERMRQYCQSYVPGLTIKTFWNTENYKWCKKLQSKYKIIQQEFQRVTSDMEKLKSVGNNIWAGALTDDAGSYGIGWKTLVLMDRGIWDPINVNLFPITAQAIYDSNVPCTEIFFASMEPHSKIQLHSDFTNFVLTCHLPIDIPYSGQNKCRLTVGDTTKQWINGEIMLFDTSLMHDAINDSDKTRYILMLRVWHPDLSDIEKQALQFTYNCLENPALISSGTINEAAEHDMQQRMKFPKIINTLGSTTSKSSMKSGFGTTSVKSNTTTKKPTKKR